ncbi:SPX domain-containing protein 1 [Hondaea fermentalgiana]|uniref:SPX domain-containing protein 1 n=1 Tax=Hondaea fermentalgiana TaxID=2315210 RepID=A0A2R5G2S2_9STRA|nr:SPX domain-containing protein 1 [Hondaea fermentalgiana]|eukprot:GBG25327.1 SPX domain-containing protein 1 [Hondaea fermentalgiana]
MKFGKKIAHAANTSTELCKPECWLDYKQLKKLLKTFEASSAGKATAIERCSNVAVAELMKNADEKNFFLFLRKELGKVSHIFAELERRALTQFLQLLHVIEAARSEMRALPAEALNPIVERLTIVHRHLVLLRNFAVLNYCGFTKILKKHDKLTGFETKDKYMLKIVNEQAFAQHTTLKKALEIIAEEYEALKSGTVLIASRRHAVDEFASSIQDAKPTGHVRKNSNAEVSKANSKSSIKMAAPRAPKNAPASKLDTKRYRAQPLKRQTANDQKEQFACANADAAINWDAKTRPRKRSRLGAEMAEQLLPSDPLFSLMHAVEMHSQIETSKLESKSSA